MTLASLGWQTSAGALYVPADDGLHHPWHPPGTIASLREVLEAMGMDRRHFVVLTGTGLTAFAHDWLLDPERVAAAVRGQRVDQVVVEDLERLAEGRRRLDDRFGGGMVFRAVREDLRMVTEMLDNSSYTEDIGHRLYAAAAELARIAGSRALDDDDQATAQRFFVVGLRAAHTSTDRALGANILAHMSKQARDHDPRDAVRLAESALAGAKDLTPAMQGSIQSQLACAAARAGDKTTAARARGRMFEFTAAVDPAVEPSYIYWWSDAEAHGHAGESALDLGNPRQAEMHFRDALSRIAPSFPRDRLTLLSRLAFTRVQLRELDGACRPPPKRARCCAATTPHANAPGSPRSAWPPSPTPTPPRSKNSTPNSATCSAPPPFDPKRKDRSTWVSTTTRSPRMGRASSISAKPKTCGTPAAADTATRTRVTRTSKVTRMSRNDRRTAGPDHIDRRLSHRFLAVGVCHDTP
ncbi:MAG: hypothetical protein ACRDTE_00430 [Pseudonocardiaceae bacterium]